MQFAIVGAVVLGGFDADRVKPLLDGARALIGGQDALAGRDHRLGNLVQLSEIHQPLPIL